MTRQLIGILSGRGGGSEEMLKQRLRTLRALGQCTWVTRNGTDGYLNCAEKEGHEAKGIAHRTHAEPPANRVAGWWFPLAEWERNFGEAARNCYSRPWRHP